MLLNIPVLDLLHSQLDIELGIEADPFSGQLTYVIKDVHSRPGQPTSSPHDNLVLTLQSPPEDNVPGTLCIRISPPEPALSEHSSMGIPAVQGLDSLCLPDQIGRHALSKTEACHTSDSFMSADSPNITHGDSTAARESLDDIINQVSLWAPIHEGVSQRSDARGAMSPVSQTLSLVASGSIAEDFAPCSSPAMHGFSDSQFSHTNSIRADYITYPTYHCLPDPINSVMDTQVGQPGIGGNIDYASCGSFSIIDLFTPPSHSGPSSPTSSTALSPKCDQIILEPHPSTPSHGCRPSIHEASSTRKGKRNLFPCPFPSCDRVLKSMYTQRIHLKTHERKPQKYFPCTMGCPESFTRHHDRLRHEVAQHGKQCEFSCKQCERFFSSQRMLDRHSCWSWRNGSMRWQQKDSPPSEA